MKTYSYERRAAVTVPTMLLPGVRLSLLQFRTWSGLLVKTPIGPASKGA